MDDRWERLRRRLIAHAALFEDGAAYTAGVEDTITAVRAMLAPVQHVAPRPRLRVVETSPTTDVRLSPPRGRPAVPDGAPPGT